MLYFYFSKKSSLNIVYPAFMRRPDMLMNNIQPASWTQGLEKQRHISRHQFPLKVNSGREETHLLHLPPDICVMKMNPHDAEREHSLQRRTFTVIKLSMKVLQGGKCSSPLATVHLHLHTLTYNNLHVRAPLTVCLCPKERKKTNRPIKKFRFGKCQKQE